MTEKRPGPAPGVRLIEVSVKRELTVCALILNHKAYKCLEKISFLESIDTPKGVR